jgi:hypothetical protein
MPAQLVFILKQGLCEENIMARSRMIKPEFWDDEKLARVSRDARLTFIGLWNHSDDYAVVKGHAGWLKNHIFPYEDNLTVGEFKGWLDELVMVNAIIPFEHNGEAYYYRGQWWTKAEWERWRNNG